jgi:hypothetical protein
MAIIADIREKIAQRTPTRIVETPVFEFVVESLPKAMEAQSGISRQLLGRTHALRELSRFLYVSHD